MSQQHVNPSSEDPSRTEENPSTRSARAVVTALVAAGVRDVVLAPGSRSAPLAYALAAAAGADWLRVHVRVDERSAGFVALGLAHEGPTAVVTTSGTAVANLHPAVLEAAHAHLPLIVVSADRPHELRGVGANQTTDQVKIFGSAVRGYWELPADRGEVGALVSSAVVRAVTAATGVRTRNAGPVQLNIAFADPLVPDGEWSPGVRPAPGLQVRPSRPADAVELPRGPRTVVVAGDGAPSGISALTERWGWPVLAEPSSGVRTSSFALPAGRVLLGIEELSAPIERVVVLGRPTLSRSVTRLLARTDVQVVVVSGHADWADVAGTAAVVCDQISVPGEPSAQEQLWWLRWAKAASGADTVLNSARGLDGAAVANLLLGTAESTVVLGSSMAVRHADLTGAAGADLAPELVVANRGLAGIDGTLSTATGLALAGRQVRALVGDLTFAHDVGGLARGRLEPEVDLQVIVLDDGGGTIFATLEHGRQEHQAVFERYFATPQYLDIAALAAGFGARHALIRGTQGLSDLARELAAPVRGRSVLQVQLDPQAERARAVDLSGQVEVAARAALVG
ncbi:2-succinyl-5-enolpyruvyl-6-hydroxy-3-cyclohexene-1-carboxylic-acid synthase [Ruania zhangjianzhongii]|uniref:2-succinyl-5-enolpyruvyl-6-hydroxy-3- cyclohexene-1-carboxylic-acid synthase n=1 Tax=Ruania zhangjianzhongii TaxID=2603206 RepID=UPI001F28938A|nr:2-succinyl-5-enolpyruvyl-6-hydroxy-3-cyclohexene-1-carboxylic-acid synthase [Ruania zhangjianzhongii]